jgi:hypothetical protein
MGDKDVLLENVSIGKRNLLRAMHYIDTAVNETVSVDIDGQRISTDLGAAKVLINQTFAVLDNIQYITKKV